MSFQEFTQAFGWVGTVMLLLAYWLISNEKVEGHSGRYQFLNITGSIALGLAAFGGRVWSSVALNGIWLLIGVAALINGRRHATKNSKPEPAQPLSKEHTP